jgi:serine/threonine protein kinase
MGLKALHEKNFIHRKVGPESIACNKDGSIKLSDLDQVRTV